ncbi:unnamed protein product [Prorocentrum cordatum]|uniref:Uncharacterized protein n=1 Tax=Prorocentrum cordatum TaxID=2364126 RepID=A0ABN9VUC5_9DINO|nr:unnamed protein product [Polarella glacialis]
MPGTGELTLPAWFSQPQSQPASQKEGIAKDAVEGGRRAKKGRKGHKEIMEACAKFLLITCREVAQLSACVSHKWFTPAEKGCVQAMVRAGQVYNERSKEMKQEVQAGCKPDFRGRGSPDLHVFVALIIYCAALGHHESEHVTEAVAELLDRLNKHISKSSLQHFGRIVQQCRVML